MHHMFIAAAFTMAMIWKQQNVLCGQIDIEHVVYIQWNSSHLKSEIFPFATTWMDLVGIMLS